MRIRSAQIPQIIRRSTTPLTYATVDTLHAITPHSITPTAIAQSFAADVLLPKPALHINSASAIGMGVSSLHEINWLPRRDGAERSGANERGV